MAQLTYNSIRKFRYYGQESGNEEKFSDETLRDTLLRRVISNQLKTDFNVEECLKNRSKFTSAIKHEDISKSTKGLLTNETFKEICSDFNLKEVLTSCGLEDHEIDILLNKTPRRGKESDDAYLQKLMNIEQKLNVRQSLLEDDSRERFSGAIQLNRHEFEEECGKVASVAAEKLTPCLVQLKPHSDPILHPDHPINSLSDLERELFPEVTPERNEEKDVTPKKRRMENVVEGTAVKYFNEKPKSFWDMKERPVIVSQEKVKDSKVYGCEVKAETSVNRSSVISKKLEENRPDYSKPFVWTLNTSKLVPLTTVSSDKMTIEQIKMDPKFINYQPGIPSSTLYVKNLPHKLSPISIVSLFGHFEKENRSKIEYRILKGKMKGQAFVKFSSVEIARKAFSLFNGYSIEGKPIVLEYSKKNV